MHCPDLERYLEAILDGRLGRGRTAVLQKHIAQCESCRARVDELRRFETDLRRRFRAMSDEESLWSHIDTGMDTGMAVTQGSTRIVERPPRRSPNPASTVDELPPADAVAAPLETARFSGKGGDRPLLRRLLPVAGMVLAIGLAGLGLLGASHMLGFWSVEQGVDETYRAVADGSNPPGLRTDDGRMLQHWLTARLGLQLPAVPTDVSLPVTGGDVRAIDGVDTAIIAYDGGEQPVLLLIRPADDLDRIKSGPFFTEQDGLNHARWTDKGFSFELVSTLAHDTMRALVEP
ncbi:MAG: zf-HC2 domain-containing protein [Geminicoccaceae bacterium]